MQKFGPSIVLLVIGAIIGLSVRMYISTNQTPSMEEQVKVTIQEIEYSTEGHSILKIELLNDAPEKNLDGNVTVYQADKFLAKCGQLALYGLRRSRSYM